MATTTFKPTINIKSSFTTIGAGFKKANKSVGSMRTILLKKTKVKRDAITGRKSLFGKRIENQRRKDEEAVVEASKPSAIGRIGNSVLNSGKGLFGRIMDFVGTLLIGWLANNLPTIITMAQDLIGRIQRTVSILGNFMRDIGAIFTGSTKVLGAVFTNITSLDFFDSNKKLSTALGELESVFDDMNKQFDDGLKTLTTPLGQMPGEAPVPPTGTDYTQPAGSGSMKGGTNEEKTMSFLISSGLTPEQAAGIAGNIQQESGFRPNADNNPGSSTEGHYGIVQWDKKIRWPRVSAYIKSIGKDPNSLEGQLYGMVWEAQTRGDWKQIKGTKSSGQSASTWLERFEKSGEKPGQRGYENRMTNASNLEKKYKNYDPGSVMSSNPKTATGGKVVEYITGDRTSPRYAADHAGRNYHDHIGFDSQKTRDAAMAFLVSKGWTIGSINTGKHVQGSLHYKNLAFDVPFYSGNNTKKRVTDDAKGETKLSSMLRADLISGGFSGPQLGGGSGGGGTSVASVPPNPPNLPSTARAPQVMIMDDRQAPQPQQPQVASGGGSAPPMIDSENVLNNLMRNYLLLDLAYT
jgi:hypothetical protein